MLDQDALRELAHFHSDDRAVLSLYLDFNPARHPTGDYRLRARHFLQQAPAQVAQAQRKALREDLERVSRYLEGEWDVRHGRALALFCCGPRLWQVHNLTVDVRDAVFVGPTPYLEPLAGVLSEHRPLCTVLVDKEKARLFLIRMGQVQECAEFFDEVPGKHKQGGWSQADLQRQHEAHVHWHLKRTVQLLEAFLQRKGVDRLAMAGPPEALAQFRRLLSPALRRRLIGSFQAELFASEAEIAAASLAVERRFDCQQKARWIERVVAAARRGGPGAIGLDDTLSALGEGRVQTLFVEEGFAASGFECGACGGLATQDVGRCPRCGASLVPIPDVVEKAIERVLEGKGKVEVVKDCPALIGVGGICAHLRF